MQWFPVKGFEGDYEVSEDGSIVRENSYLRERCSQTREHPRFLFT